MQQVSCLEGGLLLWIWPLYLHINQKSDDDDDDVDDDDILYFGKFYIFDHQFVRSVLMELQTLQSLINYCFQSILNQTCLLKPIFIPYLE